MKNLVIASGKGGTGKTTVAVNLALVLEERGVQLLDCDVEEPNAHLFMKPNIENVRSVSIQVPRIDYALCNFCGRCSEICEFNALAVFRDTVMILPELCHGCGSCSYLCPEKAISEVARPIGIIESGKSGVIDFAHGILNPGEAMSPPLIKDVKKMSNPGKINIVDAPPGTSCPVVNAVSGSDFCLLVTEPTPFGLHDLDLAFQMVSKLGIPAGVVINRYDIGDHKVEDYCSNNNIPVLQKIPWDRELAVQYAKGEAIVLKSLLWADRFKELFEAISKTAREGSVF